MNLLQSTGFLLALVACVAANLVWTVSTGWRGLRRSHFASLAVLIPLFSFTIYVAESVGRARTFDPLAFQVHMFMAWSGVVTLAFALGSGVARLKLSARLPHRIAVGSFLVAVVLAVGTGGWMISTGELENGPAIEPGDISDQEASSEFSGRVEAAEGKRLGPKSGNEPD